MNKETKFILAMDKAFQNERPVNNLVTNASRDYQIPLDVVHSIHEKDSKKFYDNLESYIKERSKK